MPLLFHNQRKSHNNLEGDQHLLKPDCDPAEQPLLLPEEYCLVEDEHATFDLHAERKGFHFLNGSVWLFKVIFIPFGKDKSKSPIFSVCLEALRNAHAVDIPFNESDHYISFEVSVEHGADLSAIPSDMSRTVREVLAEETNQEVVGYDWESCEVLPLEFKTK